MRIATALARLAAGVIRGLAALLVGYLAYVALRGSRLLVHPTVRELVPEEAGAPATPADLGLAFEEVTFHAEDGVRLAGWLVPAGRETRAAVVLLHGFSGHRLPELAVHVPWLQRRYHVLQFDFRGHGASDRGPVTMGALERLDVAAAVRFLEERDLGPIALFGVSMGAAVAILAAPRLPVRAVVADAPYARLRNPVSNRMREFGYPLPGIGSLVILAGAAARLRRRLPSPIDAVADIAPRGLLVIAPRDDRLIDWTEALELHRRAREPKELFVVDGAEHGRAYLAGTAAYEERVLIFLERYLDDVPATTGGSLAPPASVRPEVGEGASIIAPSSSPVPEGS